MTLQELESYCMHEASKHAQKVVDTESDYEKGKVTAYLHIAELIQKELKEGEEVCGSKITKQE